MTAHLASQMKLLGEVLAKAAAPRIHVCRKWHKGGRTFRQILMDGEYFIVDGDQHAKLQAGKTPEDLLLDPIEDDDCEI